MSRYIPKENGHIFRRGADAAGVPSFYRAADGELVVLTQLERMYLAWRRWASPSMRRDFSRALHGSVNRTLARDEFMAIAQKAHERSATWAQRHPAPWSADAPEARP